MRSLVTNLQRTLKLQFSALRDRGYEEFIQCRSVLVPACSGGFSSLRQFIVSLRYNESLPVVARMSQRITTSIAAARRGLADFGRAMRIRIRLSVGISLAIGIGVFSIGKISGHNQEAQLRLQTDLLGTNIIQNLVDIAKDNMLLNSIPVIHEIVFNVTKRNIPGMSSLAVVDRKGTIIAHSNIDSVHHPASQFVWQTILNSDSLTVVETEAELFYIEPIFVLRKDNLQREKIFLGAAVMSFSRSVVFASLDETNHSTLLISALGALFAFPLMFVLAGKFVQIGFVLSEAARLVGLNKTNNGIVITEKDVVGTLTRELDLMIRQIHEKSEIEKFVSGPTVQMVANGKASPSDGTRKVVAVLFSDIRNFTSISEALWPEEIVELLNQYLEVQTQIIHRHHGFVDKFMGDGVMSIFPGDLMAHDAVETAIAIQRGIAELNLVRRKQNCETLSVGIGIAVGPVVLGSIGTSERMDYTAIGDTVNLASRLCGAACSDEILVSESVIARFDDDKKFLWHPKDTMTLKGKRNPVAVYHVKHSLS